MSNAPVTAAELMAAKPLYVDHACQAWGRIVRVGRLSVDAYLALSEQYELYPRDEAGAVSRKDRYAWACDVVAATVIDEAGVLQFSEGGPRQWLAGEPGAVRELLTVAMQLNGLGTVEESADADGDPAKKNAS
jgi:hypothetical protein